ncbi:hypothetical protein [Intestinibacillus sp. Marseille-P6563]|uniref:hypothetical protein n=1 Tax=Intestinibacillus sp. Marseille-P6563 TaxID=2364792 RepID=UPI000F04DBFB|nr:hypothetical protein [Intestinibacillus sp. Marseille-P6563]
MSVRLQGGSLRPVSSTIASAFWKPGCSCAVAAIFFGSDARSTLCSDRCQKTAKRQFDGRAKGKDYEQAYVREYMLV